MNITEDTTWYDNGEWITIADTSVNLNHHQYTREALESLARQIDQGVHIMERGPMDDDRDGDLSKLRGIVRNARVTEDGQLQVQCRWYLPRCILPAEFYLTPTGQANVQRSEQVYTIGAEVRIESIDISCTSAFMCATKVSSKGNPV